MTDIVNQPAHFPRMFSTNFPANFQGWEGKCFVPLEDYNQLKAGAEDLAHYCDMASTLLREAGYEGKADALIFRARAVGALVGLEESTESEGEQ